MENYKSGINDMNYLPKSCGASIMSVDYNLGGYRQKYIGNTSAENLYNNIVKSASRGNHIGDYKK